VIFAGWQKKCSLFCIAADDMHTGQEAGATVFLKDDQTEGHKSDGGKVGRKWLTVCGADSRIRDFMTVGNKSAIVSHGHSM